MTTVKARTSRRTLAYYISAHGYGHGVRSCDIIRALNSADAGLEVVVVTDLPAQFLRSRLHSPRIRFRTGAFDVGMVQLDSIRVDVAATLERVLALHARRSETTAAEALFLRDQGVSAVVADIPPIPLEAAALAGIPAIAVSNFGWDWIYSAFVDRDDRWHAVVEAAAQGYARADLLLRLPFAEEMRAFRTVEDIPVVSSPGTCRRSEIAALTGADPAKRWILLSFTSLDWDSHALDSVESLTEYEFFSVLPLGWEGRRIHAIDRATVPFGDIAASVDAVVSKPGFGIVSDCVVNRKPLIYAEREDFLEYAVLEKAIRQYLKQIHLPASKLYRGDLREALEGIEKIPDPPDQPRLGGAAIAAKRILSFL